MHMKISWIFIGWIAWIFNTVKKSLDKCHIFRHLISCD